MKNLELEQLQEISTKEIKLIMRRLNDGQKIDMGNYWNNEVMLTDPKQGHEFLLNLWKTPTGSERKNNPFGYREIEILKDFKGFRFMGQYDAGLYNKPFFVPLYKVIGNDDGFQYYYSGGKISIVG